MALDSPAHFMGGEERHTGSLDQALARPATIVGPFHGPKQAREREADER